MSFTARDFRDALGCFATGITVVTVHPEGKAPAGMTANSFTSVSLDPPMVLWCLAKGADLEDAFASTDHFGINILSESQTDLSAHFSRRGEHECEHVPFEVWETGAPILSGALAQFDCKTVERFDAGDHWIYLGRVERMGSNPDGHPLLYYRGGYRTLPNEEITS